MPESRSPEMLPAGAACTSAEFKRRFRIGEATWRQIKKDGLRTHKLGKTIVVLADDFSEYLRTRDQ